MQFVHKNTVLGSVKTAMSYRYSLSDNKILVKIELRWQSWQRGRFLRLSFLTRRGFDPALGPIISKSTLSVTLVGTTVTRPVQEPLAALLLDNQLYMLCKPSFCKIL